MDQHNSSETLINTIDGFSSCCFSYPSGRLAMQRLRCPLFTVLFYDDRETGTNHLLGLITSEGHLMINKDHHYVIDEHYQFIDICDDEHRTIDKSSQYYFNEQNCSHRIQLNSSMELQYESPTKILLRFTFDKDLLQFQLGIPSISSQEKKSRSESQCSSWKSHQINRQSLSLNSSTNDDTLQSQLPLLTKLFDLRKQIEQICDNWLTHCRMALGNNCRSQCDIHSTNVFRN